MLMTEGIFWKLTGAPNTGGPCCGGCGLQCFFRLNWWNIDDCHSIWNHDLKKNCHCILKEPTTTTSHLVAASCKCQICKCVGMPRPPTTQCERSRGNHSPKSSALLCMPPKHLVEASDGTHPHNIAQALAQPAPRLARGLAAAWAHWGWGGVLAAPPHAE